MIFNVWTFLFQVVNFLVLVVILRWLLYNPLREAIDRRRGANAKSQADAEAAHREAEALHATLDQQLADLERRRETVIREARERAETERQSLLADAEAAVLRRRDEVEQQLARERDEALRSLRGELVHSAVELAGRLLRESSDTTLQRQLAGRLVKELDGIPENERQQLRSEWEDGEPAVVESAAELNGEVQRNLNASIASLAGRPLSVSVQVRPDLLAGVRLRIGGHVWDASMAGRLEELEAASARSASAGANGS
jgi:F-type H+-transporting ATPase subunit b